LVEIDNEFSELLKFSHMHLYGSGTLACVVSDALNAGPADTSIIGVVRQDYESEVGASPRDGVLHDCMGSFDAHEMPPDSGMSSPTILSEGNDKSVITPG
jgi:hypothetical protein